MRQTADDTKVGVGKSEPVVEGGEPVVPAPFLTVERLYTSYGCDAQRCTSRAICPPRNVELGVERPSGVRLDFYAKSARMIYRKIRNLMPKG